MSNIWSKPTYSLLSTELQQAVDPNRKFPDLRSEQRLDGNFAYIGQRGPDSDPNFLSLEEAANRLHAIRPVPPDPKTGDPYWLQILMEDARAGRIKFRHPISKVLYWKPPHPLGYHRHLVKIDELERWLRNERGTDLQLQDSLKLRDGKRTASATAAKKKKGEIRKEAMRKFVEEINSRTESRSWDAKNIPATKEQLRAVFLERYPEVGDISKETVCDLLHHCNGALASGRPANGFNLLQSLFGGNHKKA